MATSVARNLTTRGFFSISCGRLRRTFCSSVNSNGITSIPLSKPVPNLPAPLYATASKEVHQTEVTVLENGLKVASENMFGQFCTVGVAIDSGSRYEVSYPAGISHFLEKLAFASTTEFKNRDEILQRLERHGGICDCQGSRDTLIYAISAETAGLSSMVNVLSEIILRPNITEQEVEDARTAITFELESLNMRPDPDPLLMEMIHAAAFRDNTLGLPKFSPEASIPLMDRNTLYTYLKNFHSPERIVLAGVGVDHQSLVKAAKEFFMGKKKPIWTEDSSLIIPSKTVDNSYAQYTGGIMKVEKDMSDVSLGPTPIPELAHFVIGLESCSHQDDDFVAFCVLNMMMGGGGSFSAGGPGKGMYTRLYLNVLNRCHWMYSATAYNHAYADSGLFCIHASANPGQLREMVDVILRELVATAGTVHEDELSRAKTQLQSMLMMNLESRPVVFEDVARQVLANNHRKSPQYFFEEIGKINKEDIQRVASRMLRSKPSVAALGSLKDLPGYNDINAALIHKEGKMPRRFSIFR